MNRNKQTGLSLVELMIAITIGLVLMTGVVQMFISSKSVFTTQQGLSRLQETGRLAVEFISRDLRQSGFLGCMYPTAWNIDSTLNPGHTFSPGFDFNQSMNVYAHDAVPGNIPLAPNPVEDTPVLVLYAASGDSANVSRTNTANTVFVNLTSGAGTVCPSGICANDIVVISDCDKAKIFQVTAVNESGAEVALRHDAGAAPGNSRPIWGGDPNNLTETFEKESDAEVFKLNRVAYYIGEDADGNPGLYQQTNLDPSFELLRGVENLNILIGLDTNGDRAADDYVAPAPALNWENAVAARIEVLVQTPDDNATNEEQTYEFAGNEVTADDNRIRQVFTTTVGIRSRLP
ncbi:PilW family protein [Gilvimarinus chinensis]|uniref:PilW family protein n=1 Tax=Gilvimarinus chinensis TaxID=396005 RepID=UPI0003761F60|nr:PilW family protein [Gilvimarinus chinensis]